MELMTIKTTYLQSKLAYLVNSVSNFLNVSSRFQKPVREKEGYLSINNYENEKHRLEMKLREVLENNENFGRSTPVFTQSNMKTVESDKVINKNEDYYKQEPKRSFYEQNNFNSDKIAQKFISELNRHHGDKVEIFKGTMSKLESDNKSIKSKYFTLKKEVKQLQSALSESRRSRYDDKDYQNLMESYKTLKGTMENGCKNITRYFESKLAEMLKKLKEKDEKITKLKVIFKIGLEKNLRSLIAINEKADNHDTNKIEELQSHIDNLEYVIIQNKNYSERKIQELEDMISEYENNKKTNQRIKKSLEEEIIKLTKANSKVQELEEKIRSQHATIDELLNIKEAQIQAIKNLKKFEVIAEQYKFERDILEKENLEISERNIQHSKNIIEIQQEFQNQAISANKKIEEIILERNSLNEIIKTLSEKKHDEFMIEELQRLKNIEDSCLKEKQRADTNEQFTEEIKENLKENEKLFKEDIEKLKKEIEILQKEKQRADTNKQFTEEIKENLKENEKIFKEDIKKLKKEIEILQKEKQRADAYEALYTKTKENLNSSQKSFEEEIKKLKKEIEILQKEKQRADIFEELSKETKVNLNNSQKSFEEEVKKLKREIEILQKEKQRADTYERLSEKNKENLEKNDTIFEEEIRRLNKEAEMLKKELEDQINTSNKFVEEIKAFEMKLLLVTNEKEIISLELSKIRQNYRDFESLLKNKLKTKEASPFPERYIRRFELS